MQKTVRNSRKKIGKSYRKVKKLRRLKAEHRKRLKKVMARKR